MREGDLIGNRYRLQERVGGGSFGDVWRAAELVGGQLELLAAVKVFKTEVNLAEIEVLAQLDHPNILRYRATLEYEGQVCLVTEYAEGGSMQDLLRAYPTGLPVEQVETLVLGVAEALHYLHGQGLVHRDVKPGNALLAGGTVRLGDVGTVKAVGGSLSRHSGPGTVAYSAPEMFEEQVGPKSDVYSLGIAAYELLTGKLPFDGTPAAIMAGHLGRPPVIPSTLPARWRTLLERCLEKDPARRWSAAEVVGHLRPRAVDSGASAASAEIELLKRELAAAKERLARLGVDDGGAEERQAQRARTSSRPEPAPSGWVRIAPGRFVMGSPEDEPERYDDEVRHTVELTRPFLLLSTPMTQGLWQSLMGDNPSRFQLGSTHPVEQVSWFEAVACCNALSRREGLPPAYLAPDGSPYDRAAARAKQVPLWPQGLASPGYRLLPQTISNSRVSPTESEWEYACRAGTTTPFSTGRCLGTDQANYDGNHPLSGCPKGAYREKTTPVGSFRPNPWGLYDMHGNVWECCWDWYAAYPKGTERAPIVDPLGAAAGSDRVIRGGSWSSDARSVRSAYRSRSSPGNRGGILGFRPATSDL